MRIVFLLGLLLLMNRGHAQDLYKEYAGSPNRITSIIPNEEGFITAGNFLYPTDTSSDQLKVFSMKINWEGTIAWSKIYLYEKYEWMSTIKQVDSSGYVLLTTTKGQGNDNLIIRIDQNGNPVWAKKYGGLNSDFNGINNNLEVLPDRSFIISSMTKSVGQGLFDVHIVRFSQDGDPIWARTIGGSDNDRTQDGGIIREDSSIFIYGYTNSPEFNALVTDGMVIKMNLSGDTLWAKTYADWGVDYFDNMTKADSGNYLLVGNTLSDPTPSTFDGFMVKINSNGDTIWTRQMETPGHTYFHESFTTPHGHYLAGHVLDGYVPGEETGIVTKLSLNGDHLWTRYINDTLNSSIQRLYIDDTGNLYLFGYRTNGTDGSGDRGFMIRTDTTAAMGNCYFKSATPILRNTGTKVFDIHPMVIDTILPISFVTLQTDSGFTVKDFCTGVGLEEIRKEKQINFYPNPFSTLLTFNFPESTNQKITIEIIEIATGRIILSEKTSSSSYVLSIAGIASGMYIARVIGKDKVLYHQRVVCINQKE